MLAPPRQLPTPEELEALIREARARQRRRRILLAATLAVAAAAGLSAWAILPGRGGAGHAANGSGTHAASRSIDAGRVPIAEVGTSGGVTWAINESGMWLTTDGGRTWRASVPQDVRRGGHLTEHVSQVAFLDREHGWLFATDLGDAPYRTGHAAFYRTDDAGRTWQRSLPKGCCGAFSFVNRHLGFFSGSNGLYETRSGGTTWRLVPGPYQGQIPTFVDARHGITLLDGGLLWTADGGTRWNEVLLSGRPPAAGNDTVAWTPVAVVGHRLVLTAERVLSGDWRPVPYVSDDGGASWKARPFPRWWVPYVGSNDGNRLSAASRDVWFAAARRELALTTDAGRTWRRVRTVGIAARRIIEAIDFTSARVGWAIIDGPRQSLLMRTTDGGVHWKPAGPPRPPHHRRAHSS